jgi:predicted nucleic acid-binding protein
MPGFVVLDTAILSYLTKSNSLGAAYDALIGNRKIAVSFQTIAELWSGTFSPSRQMQLDRLTDLATLLPHHEETSRCYARVARARAHLLPTRRPGRDSGDADMWIIASAIEHRLPLITHDKQMVALAREVECDVLTLLAGERRLNPL